MTSVWELSTNTSRNIIPSEALLEQWIKTSWDDDILPEFTSGVSNDMTGAEDDVLWEEDHEENSSSSD
jgi:hypothetical protein